MFTVVLGWSMFGLLPAFNALYFQRHQLVPHSHVPKARVSDVGARYYHTRYHLSYAGGRSKPAGKPWGRMMLMLILRLVYAIRLLGVSSLRHGDRYTVFRELPVMNNTESGIFLQWMYSLLDQEPRLASNNSSVPTKSQILVPPSCFPSLLTDRPWATATSSYQGISQ